jgi:hypothetical protein
MDIWEKYKAESYQKLVDFNLGTSESNFTVSNEYLESGYNKKQFLDIKQKNCRYLN